MNEFPSNRLDRYDAANESHPGAGRHGALRALVGIVATPRRSFEIIRRQKPWVITGILLALGTIALGLASAPLSLEATRAQMTTMMPNNPEQVDALMAQMEQSPMTSGWVTSLTVPPVLAVQFLFQAAFVWLLAVALQGQPRFVPALSLLVHLNVIEHLQGWANLLLLHVRGPGAIESMQDMQAPMGLDLLLSSDSAFLNTVYASINPFTVWLVVLLGLGARTVFRLSPRKAGLLAAIYWAAGTAFQAGLAGVLAPLMPG